jgi:hypothetical protein
MASPMRITLRYSGRDVDNGTMPIDEVVDALQGFSGAYGKIANHLDPGETHQLRVSAIRTGSFELLIVAWAVLTQTGDQLAALETLGNATRYVLNVVAGVIGAKKHTKGQPYSVSVRGDNNTVVVVNAEGAELAIPPEAFNVFKEKLIEGDLNRIAAPLRQDSVDSAEIVADDDSHEPIEAIIRSDEREYFRPDASLVTTREIELAGLLVSLNKETNRGTFKLTNNKNVRYHYIGERPDSFHADFAYKGPVRVVCVAHFDENLELTHLEVKSVQRLQRELGFTDSSPN